MAVDLTQPPTAQDAYKLLNESKFIEKPLEGVIEEVLQSSCAAIYKEVQMKTGFTPFIAQAAATERRFVPPGPTKRTYVSLLGGGRKLFLETGIVELEKLEVERGDGREEFTRDEDFYLGPENADAEGQPWTMVEFTQPIFARRQGIIITARYGYADAMPADLWEAMRQGVAAHVITSTPDIPVAIAVGQAGFNTEYDQVGLMTPGFRLALWQKKYEATVDRYRLAQ